SAFLPAARPSIPRPSCTSTPAPTTASTRPSPPCGTGCGRSSPPDHCPTGGVNMHQSALTSSQDMHYYSGHVDDTGNVLLMSPLPPEETAMSQPASVDYRTDPSPYRHGKLSVGGPLATLAVNIDEDGGIRPGYKLKLNSYDLGVDIELHDALNRVRFEHPQVRTVVVTSLKDRVFCSGANIFMLGLSSHAWKVNFCKFTNETRNGIEDSSKHSGLKFIAALNGACAGGGYELALACDEIVLVDDRSSAVSL